MARLREKHRRRKEKAFEEEGESGEPPRELISMLFSIPIRCRHPSTIPIQEVTTRRVVNRRIWRRKDQGRRWLEQRKRQSFITSSATLRPFSLRSSLKARDVNGLRHILRRRPKTSAAFDIFAAFFVECRRRGDEKKRRRHRRSYVVGTRTAHYRAVLPKIDRRWSISAISSRLMGELDRRRSIEGEIDRQQSIEREKGKMKKRKKKKKKKKKEKRRKRIPIARGSRAFFLPRGEKDQGDITSATEVCTVCIARY
ncbi:hypothetical protein BHM03_00019421 [Ensete ventricosum]|nr:hypothetical protein BHM03_00019421 [Ensete ventricosum]